MLTASVYFIHQGSKKLTISRATIFNILWARTICWRQSAQAPALFQPLLCTHMSHIHSKWWTLYFHSLFVSVHVVVQLFLSVHSSFMWEPKKLQGELVFKWQLLMHGSHLWVPLVSFIKCCMSILLFESVENYALCMTRCLLCSSNMSVTHSALAFTRTNRNDASAKH